MNNASVYRLLVQEETTTNFSMEAEWLNEGRNGVAHYAILTFFHESMTSSDLYIPPAQRDENYSRDRSPVFASNIPYDFFSIAAHSETLGVEVEETRSLYNWYGVLPYQPGWTPFFFPGEREGSRILKEGIWFLVVGSDSAWRASFSLQNASEIRVLDANEKGPWQAKRLRQGEWEHGEHAGVGLVPDGASVVLSGAASVSSHGKGILFAGAELNGIYEVRLLTPDGIEMKFETKTNGGVGGPVVFRSVSYHRADLAVDQPGDWNLVIERQVGTWGDAFLFYLDL